jgi:cell division protein FtsL
MVKTKTKIIWRRGSVCRWQPPQVKKTKINIKVENISGFVKPRVLILLFAAAAAGFYIYSINNSAVQGQQIKKIENSISELRKEQEDLKIREAEVKSLKFIEDSSKQINMSETVQVSYIEAKSPLAMKK